MKSESGTVERAFELARSGACQSLEDIRRALRSEGYGNIHAHLGGATIKKQLTALMRTLPKEEQ